MKWMKHAYGKWRDGLARRWLLLATLLLAVTFVLALHPATGVLGGLFLLFTGWAIPSLLNILVALLIVSLFPAFFRRPTAAVPVLLVVSFLLAVAVEAPVIALRIFHAPSIPYTVTRVVSVPSGWVRPSVEGCAQTPGFPCPSGLYVVANPLTRVIDMGGNEGCGCSYWTVPDTDAGGTARSFTDYLAEDIKRQMQEDDRSRNVSVPNLSIVVAGRPNQENPNLLDLKIDVKDGAATTATLTEQGVPRYRRAFIDSDRAVLLNGHFFEIAMHDITHDTFWSPLVGRRFGYYPRQQVQRFLKESIHVQPPAPKADLYD
jgi:hypothetical protein